MSIDFLVPLLAFSTLFAVIWIGVFGIKGAKKAKRENHDSALADE